MFQTQSSFYKVLRTALLKLNSGYMYLVWNKKMFKPMKIKDLHISNASNQNNSKIQHNPGEQRQYWMTSEAFREPLPVLTYGQGVWGEV